MHECIRLIDPPPQAVGLGRNHAPFIQTEKCALFSLKLAFDLYPMSLKKQESTILCPCLPQYRRDMTSTVLLCSFSQVKKSTFLIHDDGRMPIEKSNLSSLIFFLKQNNMIVQIRAPNR